MSSTVLAWDDVCGGGAAAQRRRRSRADKDNKGAQSKKKSESLVGIVAWHFKKRLQAALQRINSRHCCTVLIFLTPQLYIHRGRLFMMEAGHDLF